MTRALAFLLMLALAGCGADGAETRFAVAAGERLEIDLAAELGGVPTGPLPDGASIDSRGRFEWIPAPAQEGEHVIPLQLGEMHGDAMLVIEVSGRDEPRIVFGGCDCGWDPEPPRPVPRTTDVAGAAAIGIVFLVRRRRHR